MLETLASVAQIVGGIGILVAAATFLVHRSQLNFDVITNCTQRFQEIVVDLKAGHGPRERRARERYVDLCNEQLFYFANGYLPREVIEEWLDGMIYYLPLFDDKTQQICPEHHGIVEPDLLDGYPRIKEAFTVEGADVPHSPDQRKTLARRIGKKLRPEPVFLVVWRDIRSYVSKPKL